MSEPFALSPPDPLGPPRAPAWGKRISLRVLFPCEVRYDKGTTCYRARCRELGIMTKELATEEDALDVLRTEIREAAIAWSKRKTGS
jgi:hypothetical protein